MHPINYSTNCSGSEVMYKCSSLRLKLKDCSTALPLSKILSVWLQGDHLEVRASMLHDEELCH